MKHSILHLISCCLVALMAISFSSCELSHKEKGASGLRGMYRTAPDHILSYDYIYVVNFINNNTLEKYLAKNSPNDWSKGSQVTSVPGHSGWYYDSNNVSMFTYVRDDNKVIIPMAGLIGTISGDKIYIDGSKDVYTKW